MWNLNTTQCEPFLDNPATLPIEDLDFDINDKRHSLLHYPDRDDSIVSFGEYCEECAVLNNDEFGCMATQGCGWSAFEKKCVSGRPDWPTTLPSLATQWDLPGVCLQFTYNEKKAFKEFALLDSFGLTPVSGWPANHPKVYAAVAGGALSSPAAGVTPMAGDVIGESSFWSRNGALRYDDISSSEVSAGMSFYAYNYPNANAPNTGGEHPPLQPSF